MEICFLKKLLISFIKITLPLAFGVFLIWYVYDDLNHEEREQLYDSFRNAEYLWIWFSLLFGILSHLSRAYRWKFILEPLGLKPRFWNSFFAVMIGYMANMLLPRLGEVSRPGVLRRYEKMPFDKLFGTVVAERAADLAILTVMICAVIISEFDVLKNALSGLLTSGEKKYSIDTIATVTLVFLCIVIIFLIILKKSSHPFMLRIKNHAAGFATGIKSIFSMKSSWKFIFHTFFIWLMYILMFYICFFSLPETLNASFMGILAAFVMGGLSVVFIQGGIGIYPAAIMGTLALYGIAEPTGLALGWIIWTAQTLMIIFLGSLSLILVPVYNKKRIHEAR